MERINIRTTETWKRFDFWAIIICIILILLLLFMWLSGKGPASDECCSAEEAPIAEVVQKPPVEVAPVVVAVPEPEPIVLEDYSLSFFKAGDKVILEGTVADALTRDSIIFDASQRFGSDNVISNLRIADNIVQFDAMNLAGTFSQLSDVDDFRIAVTPQNWSVFGTISDKGQYDSIRAKLSGTVGTLIANQLTLVEQKPVINCELQLSINPVEFESSSAAITDAGKQAIAQTIQCLSDNNYNIVGHTDLSGDASFNQILSLQRATAVKDYLNSLGVGTDAYQVTGSGESEPLVDSNDADANSRNRRVEFKQL